MCRLALKAWWMVAVLALTVAAWPADVRAGVPLTQMYVSRNGAFRFSYPAGWLRRVDRGTVVIASDAPALKGVGAGGDVVPGQIRMVIWPTRTDLPQASGASLAGKGGQEVMQLVIGEADLPPGTEAPKDATPFGDKRVWSLMTKNSQGYGVLLLAVETGGGEITAAMVETAPGEAAKWQSTVLAIAATFDLRGWGTLLDQRGRLRQWASSAEATSQYGDDDWSAARATGGPQVGVCGDDKHAWASKSPTGTDTLTLYYDTPVVPYEINIYESFSPGSITSVDLMTADGGRRLAVDNSASTDQWCTNVFTLRLKSGIEPVDGVSIHLDQTIVGNWDEIDAVELVGFPVGPAGVRQWALLAAATSEYGEPDWSAMQAAGSPDVHECSDNKAAWASATETGEDTLTLDFDQAVEPVQVNIFQTFTPGSIVGVDLLPSDGSEPLRVPNSADADTACPHVFRLTVPSGFPHVDGVVIHLDQSIGGSWNEIDAVQLVGR